MKKKSKALEKIEKENYGRQKDHSLKMRTSDLQNKQNLEKENFRKRIKLELEIFEKEKLKSFDE